MKEKKTKQIHAYKIDLTKIRGKGEFLCPRCGITISPDDQSEDVYTILDITVNIHGLEEVTLNCNKCNSQILLTGFSAMQKLPNLNEDDAGTAKEETFCYFSHI